MTDPLPVRIIDRITEQVEAQADLPRHQTVKYRRPRAVLPEDCPVLVVWLLGKIYAPRTTNNFDNAMNVGISWQEQAVDEAETLIDNEGLSKSLISNLDGIENAVRHMSIDGWDIPEAYDLIPVSVDWTPPSAGNLDTGLVEGYAMTAQVHVLEKPT